MDAILPLLIECLESMYDASDLKKLVLILGIPPHTIVIQGQSISDSSVKLVQYFQENYGSVDRLVEAVIQTRPMHPHVIQLKELYLKNKQDAAQFEPGRNRGLQGMQMAAILFCDMQQSTDKLKTKNEKEVLELIDRHDDIIRERIKKYHGRELRKHGDEFVVVFQLPKDAVLFALDAQQAFALWNAAHILEHDKIRVRMGLHFGVARLTEGRAEGETAVIASRVSKLAHGEEIIVTELVKFSVEKDLVVPFRNFSLHSLKGLENQPKYQLYKIDWKGL